MRLEQMLIKSQYEKEMSEKRLRDIQTPQQPPQQQQIHLVPKGSSTNSKTAFSARFATDDLPATPAAAGAGNKNMWVVMWVVLAFLVIGVIIAISVHCTRRNAASAIAAAAATTAAALNVAGGATYYMPPMV